MRGVFSVSGLLACAACPAWGQTAASVPTSADTSNDDIILLGNMGGLRPALAVHGVTITLTDTSEVLGNPTGGARPTAVFEGAGFGSLALDGDSAGLWEGLSAQVSAWGIYGRGLSATALNNLSVASNLEADRSLRLFEMWIEQALPGGAASLRVGQQAADQEFIVDQYGAIFINADFGFPDLPATDLPSGGAAYPLATPAVRLKLQPRDDVTLLAALFNGDPVPRGPGDDPQARDASGTAFRTDGGAFWIGELDYARNQGDQDRGLPGTFKIGAWYNSNNFADQRFDTNGLKLADPASNGQPLPRRGDWSVYALLDQEVWRPARGQGGVGVFLRVMGAPGDRNLVDYAANAGVSWQGIIPGRTNDTAGLGVLFDRVGDQASKADGDVALFSGRPYPVRRWETVIEMTYQAQIRAGWQVQPDVQYIFRPGGLVPDPDNPALREGDALVLGLRTLLTF